MPRIQREETTPNGTPIGGEVEVDGHDRSNELNLAGRNQCERRGRWGQVFFF